jgi:hypothetical protein
MEFSQREWEGRGPLERGAALTSDSHARADETDSDDSYPEDVTAALLGVAGVLGLLVLLAVVGAVGAATALLRYW